MFLCHLWYLSVHCPCSVLFNPVFISLILHGSSPFFCFNHWISSIVTLFHTCFLQVPTHTLLIMAFLCLYNFPPSIMFSILVHLQLCITLYSTITLQYTSRYIYINNLFHYNILIHTSFINV